MPQYEMRFRISLAIGPIRIVTHTHAHLLSRILSEFLSAPRDICVHSANSLLSIIPTSPLL